MARKPRHYMLGVAPSKSYAIAERELNMTEESLRSTHAGLAPKLEGRGCRQALTHLTDAIAMHTAASERLDCTIRASDYYHYSIEDPVMAPMAFQRLAQRIYDLGNQTVDARMLFAKRCLKGR